MTTEQSAVLFVAGMQVKNAAGTKTASPENQQELDTLLEKGWEVVAQITPPTARPTNQVQNRQVYATKNPAEMRAGVQKLNETKRTIPTELAILGKSYQAKAVQFLRKGGELDGYWDTQVQCEGKTFCIAAQDWHDTNLAFTITVVNKQDTAGNIVEGFKFNSSL